MVRHKIVMVGYQFRPCLLDAVRKVNEVLGGVLDFRFYNTYDVDGGLVDAQKFVEDLRSSSVVLLDVRGGDAVSKIICEELKGLKNTVVVFVGGSPEIINLTRLGSFSLSRFAGLKEKPLFRWIFKKSKVDYGTILKMRERFEKLGGALPAGMLKHARNYSLLLKYYDMPSFQNYYAMLLLLLKEYCKARIDVDVPEPVVMPSMGIKNFKTEEIYTDVRRHLQSYEFSDRPLVAILFYGGYHYDQSYPAAKLLTEKLEELGLGAVPIFCSDLRYYLAIEKFMFLDGKPIVEAFIDLLWFRLAGGPIGGDHDTTKELLLRLNVPALHGVHLSSNTVDEWFESKHGLPPVEVVTTVILPELDGRNEPVVTHAVKKRMTEGVKLEEYVAIEDRVEKLAQRAAKWVNLRRKPNSQKRIAIILYNYPPGEENIGKAANLDVFESLSRLLKAMKEKGYHVTDTPSGKDLKDIFITRGLVNSGEWIQTPTKLDEMIKMSLEKYCKILEGFPEKPRNAILREWGPPPGDIMVYESSLIIPGVIFGNVFVGLQPSRGVHEDASKIYHDKDLPPHHQYVAFYGWVKDEFGTDAIIHLGTHGTLEFLPGKEVGLSSDCFPDILIADIPNIYVYHAVNSSESSIAKRRSYATIINHASPPMVTSGLYGEFEELERLTIEYFDSLQYGKDRAYEVARRVLEKAQKYGLGSSVEEIYDKIQDFKRSIIPRGLHVLGDKPSMDEVIAYLTFLSRYDRGEIRSLHRLILESKGLNYAEVLEKPHNMSRDGRRYSEVLSDVEEMVKNLITEYIQNGSTPKLNNVNMNEVLKTLNFLKDVYGRIVSSDEIGAVLKALEGKFVEPGPGGDFIRTPEVYPTGRNTYQLDPTNIPTEVAMERGRKIAEDYLRNFYKKHGKYPKVVSVVLWAFETMKTGGETIAAVFHLLGVKPVWKSIYIRDLAVIPLSELGRPRIDVVVTICGIFRDTFYNLVELLDKAVRQVATLEEPEEMNYVKANIRKMESVYGEDASLRIFGPPEGLYATSLTKLIESSEWKSEAELVNAYMESMKFAYGEKRRSVEAEKLLDSLLSNVEVVTQIRDTVDYEITDLDHYYEFLGGLTKAVESRSGKRPLVLVADTTRETTKVEDAGESVKRGIVTRTINPKWLDAMIKHGFNGATKIADRVEYMLGLSATLGGVEDWMWSKVAENLIFDKERAERIKDANVWAFRKIIGKLLEAAKRGYWKADKQTLERLEDEYLKTEEILESEE
ncbi:MAG: magnesium chelatase subunit H [Candidatus Bathyarchaeia archaeon]